MSGFSIGSRSCGVSMIDFSIKDLTVDDAHFALLTACLVS